MYNTDCYQVLSDEKQEYFDLKKAMQILILGKHLPLQTAFGLAFLLGHFQLKN